MKMLIDKLVKDWAWRVNDGCPDPSKKDHLEFLEETLRANGMTEKFIKQFMHEIDFKDKADFAKYNAKHDMRPTTKVNIGGKDTTAGDADPKAKDTVKKKKPKSKPSPEEKLQKKIETHMPKALEAANEKIDNVAFSNEQDEQTFKENFPKLLKGEDVSPESIDVINKYARIKKSESAVEIYIANKEPGDFRQGARDKIEIKGGAAGRTILGKMKEKGMQEADPITSKESVPVKIGTKTLTLGKLSGGKTISNPVEVEKLPSGIITQVKVGDHIMRRQPMPDKEKLISEIIEMKSQNPDATDEEVNYKVEQLQSGIIRYNNLIDSYDGVDNLESVSLVEGANPATEKGREKIAKEGPSIVADGIEKALGENPTKAEKQVVDDLRKLGDIDDPEEYTKEAMAILDRMGSIASIKKGAPDVAESIVLLAMNKQGKPTIAPAGETFPVADLIVMPTEDLDPQDPEYVKKIAAGGKTIISMTDSGGLSVKKDGGAASGFTAKLDMTTFKKKETKESLRSVLNQHNNFIGGAKKGSELSNDKIEKGKKQLDLNEKLAIKNGLIKEGDIVFKDGRSPRQWAEANLKKWESEGDYKNMTPENRKLLLDGMEQYARGGLLLEKIHNKDLAFQDYSNANANTKTGEIEMSDGINCVNHMAFSANPGFKPAKDKNGNWVARPNSVYAGNLKKVCR